MIPGNVHRYIDSAGEHRWRFVSSGNNKILAHGGEGYEDLQDMENALNLLWPDPIYLHAGKCDTDEVVAASLAILTLVTGEDWDRQRVLDQSGSLRDIAVHTLKKQGLTSDDANTFVDERWKKYAEDIPLEPELVEAKLAPPGPDTPEEPVSMRDRMEARRS